LTDNPTSLAFFDRERGLHGSLRAGLALLFEGREPTALPEPAAIAADGDGWRATLTDQLSLAFEPCSPSADLGGATVRVCRVRGEVAGKDVECLGTAVDTAEPPAWAELDAVRSVSAIFDEQNALFALALRPRGALGHGQESVTAWILSAGELLAVEDARLSTVYDGEAGSATPVSSCGCRARTSRAGHPGPWSPERRWRSRAWWSTPPCSTGAWRATRAPAPTT